MTGSFMTLKSAAIALTACCALAMPAAAADKSDILNTYADIANAMYEDSLISAKMLKKAVDALIASPSEETMLGARAAWLKSREPYQQTEGYRFGNAIVDDWEGRVNAWPLDEGLIDYVDASYGDESDENALYVANVVANPSLRLGGETVDASTIDKALLQDALHEADGVEANVATGYHAIEFLLWGQDLNGVGPGAGARPYTDFSTSNCTNGNCDRRAQYLSAAADLLIDDLEEMVAAWADGGDARKALTADGADAGVATILTGLGSLSYGELAGERMKLGLLLNDPEEEHDCFADNTHNSHYFNQVGMSAIINGHYARIDGSVVSGPSLADLIAETDTGLASEVESAMGETFAKMDVMRSLADRRVLAYDQMLDGDNEAANAVLQGVIDGLVGQARTFEKVVAALDLGDIAFEGSDSLDDPSSVQ